MLPISILTGACSYLLLARMDCVTPYKAGMLQAIGIVQPLLLFAMLLLTFCRVKLTDLRLSGWHLWALGLQIALFLFIFLLRLSITDVVWGCIAESMMLCFICPTATAAVVVTTRLGGNPVSLTLYTILINLCVAVIIPLSAPVLQSVDGLTGESFMADFTLVGSRVFPLLAGPMLLAPVMRRLVPSVVAFLCRYSNLPFYLWSVSLTLAIAVSTRSIVDSPCPHLLLCGIGIGSLLACAVQFAVGRMLGNHYQDRVAAAQALGQKNTVLVIWMGYTFFTPITSLAGGFYSIWHNLYNSYQLYRVSKGK